ncbi:PREDICTED: elastin-like [Drosophila arizonae]|uniref:Elastin-like n=1 Tax=Drosophila arizonae TaxID=7263 RepID=A0ABM1PUU0_DROAR|nr:PREDICTED: elastin-like [Drosophila arizonae]
MSIIKVLLLSCLAYGVVAVPPVPPYVSPIGAVSPGYRPGLPGPIAYGSVLGGGIGGVSRIGGVGGIGGIGAIGGVGGISSGYPYGRVNQQIPAYGSLIGRKFGAPVGIVGRPRINPGYQQGIVSPISSGYGYQGIPNKYSRGPY